MLDLRVWGGDWGEPLPLCKDPNVHTASGASGCGMFGGPFFSVAQAELLAASVYS